MDVPQWVGNLEITWDNPLYERFLNRLALRADPDRYDVVSRALLPVGYHDDRSRA